LHARLVAETHLADSEFKQVTENRNSNSNKRNNSNTNNNMQDEWISEAKATLTVLNYEPGKI